MINIFVLQILSMKRPVPQMTPLIQNLILIQHPLAFQKISRKNPAVQKNQDQDKSVQVLKELLKVLIKKMMIKLLLKTWTLRLKNPTRNSKLPKRPSTFTNPRMVNPYFYTLWMFKCLFMNMDLLKIVPKRSRERSSKKTTLPWVKDWEIDSGILDICH